MLESTHIIALSVKLDLLTDSVPPCVCIHSMAPGDAISLDVMPKISKYLVVATEVLK